MPRTTTSSVIGLTSTPVQSSFANKWISEKNQKRFQRFYRRFYKRQQYQRCQELERFDKLVKSMDSDEFEFFDAKEFEYLEPKVFRKLLKHLESIGFMELGEFLDRMELMAPWEIQQMVMEL